MPNWCDCELTITGKTDEVQKLKETVKEGDNVLSANKIIPYPEEFRILDRTHVLFDDPLRSLVRETVELTDEIKHDLESKGYDLTKDGFNQGGYDWCIQNWGTKWGFCHTELASEYNYQGETELEYHFDTAWSPPIPLIKKLGEMFPSLEVELRYFEAGAGFNGMLRMKDGKVEMDEVGKYFGLRGG